MRPSVPLLVAVAAAVALGGSPAAAKSPARRLPKCLSWTDPTGDGGPAAAATNDPALDIENVVLGFTKDALTVRTTVDQLGDNPTKTWGDRFQLTFTWSGRLVDVYYKRSRARDTEGALFYQQGIRVDGVFATESGVTGNYNAQTNVMTLSVTLRTLQSVVGKGIQTGTLESISMQTFGSLVAQNLRWDTSTTTAKAKVTPCV